jgi:hypothetical protein
MTAIAPKPRPRAASKRRATPEEIARQTVVLFIERNIPSFSRKMRAGEVVAESDSVDRTMLHVSKDLLDRKLLREISRVDRDLRAWLESKSVACSMLARGMWLIPLPLVPDVDGRVIEWAKEIKRLAAVLAREAYAPAVAEARKRLGKHFKAEEYPSADELEASFGARAKWITFNVPAALEDLNKEMYERVRQRVEAEWATAGDEIRVALRESFAGLIETLADKLSEDADGKPRIFRDSTVEKLTDFLATFAARDLTGDEDLAALARQAQGLLKGKAPDDLRKQEDVRARVRAGMEAIKGTLKKMDVQAPKSRRIKVEEDE